MRRDVQMQIVCGRQTGSRSGHNPRGQLMLLNENVPCLAKSWLDSLPHQSSLLLDRSAQMTADTCTSLGRQGRWVRQHLAEAD